MDTRKAAKEIIARADVIQDKVVALKNDVEALLRFVMLEVKKTTGEIPSKEIFLDIVAKIIDEILALPFPLETIDDFIALKVLKGVDKAILSNWFGSDWFEKLKEKVDKI